MVAVLISSVLVLGLVAIAIYFWQKPAKTSETIDQQQHQLRGLFSDFRLNQLRTPPEGALAENASKVDSETFEQAISAIRTWQQSPNRESIEQRKAEGEGEAPYFQHTGANGEKVSTR